MDLKKQEDFLNHIASKLGRPRKSGVKPPKWESQPYLHLYEGKSHEELIEDFIANLGQLNTKVDRISRHQFAASLGNVIQDFEVRSAVYWDDATLHALQLSDVLEKNQIDAFRWDPKENEEEMKQRTANVDLGIVYADLGLAETGTVVLFNGGGRGRLVSLLPPKFLCILSERDIVPRLTQAVQKVHDRVSEGLPACINFITGPSRTGDIEMDLAFGVHGPGKVHIILLRDE